MGKCDPSLLLAFALRSLTIGLLCTAHGAMSYCTTAATQYNLRVLREGVPSFMHQRRCVQNCLQGVLSPLSSRARLGMYIRSTGTLYIVCTEVSTGYQGTWLTTYRIQRCLGNYKIAVVCMKRHKDSELGDHDEDETSPSSKRALLR